MAERQVSVVLRAKVADYQKGISDAQRSTTGFGKEIERTKKMSDDNLRTIGTAATVAGGVLAVGFGKAMMTSASFEKQLSGVAAVSDASASQMEKLSEAALKAGASTKLAGVSASDAARAEAELVKAGISVSDVLGGALMGSLSLASAGQLDFGKAAEISAQAMNMFELKGKDVGMIADVLAAAANKSAADVTQLGEALRQGGLVASQMGLSMEETVGTLALFADNALIGSDAGTSLKTMLQRLTPQSNEAAQEMERLGFSAFDAKGEFIGMEGLAREMTESFGGLTTQQRSAAMATIFGSDAVRAASVLYTAGEAKVREYNLAVLDEGAAARMAAKQMNNLAGDVEALGGALETAFIKGGSQATGVLRELVQGAADAVTGFSAMPSAVQGGAVALAGLGSAGLLAIGAIATMLPKIREAKKALEGMGAAGQFASRNMAGIAAGVGGAIAGLALLANALGKSTAQADEMIAKLSEDIDTSTYEGMAESLQAVNAAWQEAADKTADNPWETLTQTARGFVEVLTPMENSVLDNAEATKSLSAAHAELQEKTRATGENLYAAMEALGLTRDEVESLAERYGIDLSGALDEVQPALTAASAEQDVLSTAMRGTTGATTELSETYKLMAEATQGMLDPLAAFGTALDEKKATLQGFTDQQIANTGQSKETWSEFVGNTKLSLGEYAAALEEQNQNVRDWHANLATVANTAGSDVALALFKMGEEGVHLTAEMANGTTEEAARMATALREQSVIGGGGVIAELEAAFKIATQVSAGGARNTVAAMAEQLNIGVDEVRRIASKYGIALKDGVHPILIAVKGPGGLSGIGRMADGGFYANGGMKESHQAQIARAGDWRVWAEPETGGEAYIPLAPAKRSRSLGIWAETGRRLGLDPRDLKSLGARDYAQGGFDSVSDVPRPPPSPHGPPISTVSGTSWQNWYGTVRDIVARYEAMGGPLGGSLVEIGRSLQRQGFRVGEHPAFGGVAPVHTKNSYHYRGRALDINWSPAKQEPAKLDALYRQLRGRDDVAELLWRTKGHYGHLHLAMAKGGIMDPYWGAYDQGGYLQPGWNMAYNGTGAPEPVGASGSLGDIKAAVASALASAISRLPRQPIYQTFNRPISPQRVARELARELG